MAVRNEVVERALAAVRAVLEPARPEKENHGKTLTSAADIEPLKPIKDPDDFGPADHEVTGAPEELHSLEVERGYMTIDDLPELERRLRLSGWKVERIGNELRCWSKMKQRWRIQ